VPVQRILRVPNPPQCQRRQRPSTNIFRGAAGRHRNQQAQPFIKINQRRCAPAVRFQPYLDRFRPVVVPLEQRTIAIIAAASLLWWTPRYVKHRFALLARSPPAQPRYDFRQRQFVIDHRCQRNRVLVQLMSQRLSLRQCSWEAVQNEPAAASQTPAPLPHHLPHRRVRHQRAPPHIIQRFLHRRRQVAFRLLPSRPKYVSGRQMTRMQPLVQQVRLCTLADSRRPQQHQPPRGRSLARRHVALRLGPFQPCRAFVRSSHPPGLINRRKPRSDSGHTTSPSRHRRTA
jgi:hypothetical protein